MSKEQEQLMSRLLFLMRRLHNELFTHDLRPRYTEKEYFEFFARKGIIFTAVSPNVELPLRMRLDIPRTHSFSGPEQVLEQLEDRIRGKAIGTVQVYFPNKIERHRERFIALYTIEALLYSVLMECADMGWSLGDVENKATQFAQIVLFGSPDEFSERLLAMCPTAENVLDAVVQLHEDSSVDLPVAPVVTHLSHGRKACHCAHTHFIVKPDMPELPADIVKQYIFGPNGSNDIIKPTITNLLSSPVARKEHNRIEQRDNVLTYLYTVARTEIAIPAMQRMHPPRHELEVCELPLLRVAVVAKIA